MLNDRQASELISKSLSGVLSDEEAQQVERHISECDGARSFAMISRVIQTSLCDIALLAEAGDASVGPCLATEAKQRLRDSLALAAQQAPPAEQDAGGVTLAVSQHDAAAGTTAGQDQPAAARQLVSRFTLIRKLGEGGLGTVWLARDERLRRVVAIKEMNSEAAESPKAWQRFHREAELTGLLEHPNVVPLYQFGSDPKSGQPFYAMRFLGKRTLADAIHEYHERRRGGEDVALELHRLLTAFQGACQAIAYAHSRGVIHRDLKPDNVALDSYGQVIVLDWGLAKLVHDAELATHLAIADAALIDDTDMSQTLDGEIIGTPLYMAPEQAAGDQDKIDERTDVYGLGAILFAILTGSGPHQHSYADGGANVSEVLIKIAAGETPAPRAFNPDVPADLETICMRAMSRQRFARHASAADLAGDVERWVAGQRSKQEQYDTLRMEGRELRANLQSSFRDLATNVRFMANLPPIQGIADAALRNPKERDVWRQRLAVIYRGLLQANSDYNSVAFCQITDQEVTELVRVERHSTDTANVRTVPKSRLRSEAVGAFAAAVILLHPDEFYTALSEDCRLADGGRCALRLSAGVPVFDEVTEEPFGMVVIECNLQRVLEHQMRSRDASAAKQLLIVSPLGVVVTHDVRGPGAAGLLGMQMDAALPRGGQIREQISRHGEFVDDSHREIYATGLTLMEGSQLTLVLSQVY